MTQKSRNEGGRAVVCLFCGIRTFVPASPFRDTVSESDSGGGIAIVRCHICHKEAPYSASDMLSVPGADFADGAARSRVAGV